MKHECVHDNNPMYVACSLVCVFVLFSVMRFGGFHFLQTCERIPCLPRRKISLIIWQSHPGVV